MLSKFTLKEAVNLALIATSLATSSFLAAPLRAATLVNHALPISQSSIGCITPDLCVLVGRNIQGGTGDVMVASGKIGKPSDVTGTQALVAVSCPVGGCIAFGQTTNPTEDAFTQTDEDGKVLGSTTYSVPRDVSFTSISCYSLSICYLFGTGRARSSDVAEFGIWGDSPVFTDHFPLPAGISRFSGASISCYATACVAVGSGFKGASRVGLVLDIVRRSLVKTSVQPGAAMTGVSCISPTLCYAVGNNAAGGFVVEVNDGTSTLLSPVKSVRLAAIACPSASCLAVGSEQTRRDGQPAGSEGALVSVSSGKVTSTTLVRLSRGFTSVSAPLAGVGFAAVGPAQGAGGVLTTTS